MQEHSAQGVVEFLVESVVTFQSVKSDASSWKYLINNIRNASRYNEVHGNKPAVVSAEKGCYFFLP